jgi:hypothetical protein
MNMAAWMLPAAMIGSSLLGASSARSAAKAQENATREAAAAQERMFNKEVELREPFRQAGVNALPELVDASRYTPFGMEQFQADPGYGFRFKEGLRALEASKAAGGGSGLRSGNTMRGLVQYGQGLASDEFTNAFNRYQLERNAKLGPLQSLVGIGQTTANTMANAAGNYGNTLAQNAAAMGNIRASGYMNQANAVAGGLGQYLNYAQNKQIMDRYFPEIGPTDRTG